MPKVIVYSTESCFYCSRAKALLKQRGVPFEEKVISYDDEKIWDDLFRRTGMKTVPQIFADERVIGGYTELTELDRKDQLASLK
jgi:glutaredoxin 3